MTYASRGTTLPLLFLFALCTTVGAPAYTLDDPDPAMFQPRPWPAKRLPCTDATVKVVQPRLGGTDKPATYPKSDFDESGVEVIFTVPAGYRFFNSAYPIFASVTHYQGEKQNDVMASEKPGDKVQICLVGMPVPEYDAQSKAWICNPDDDARGYTFRVYDYKRHAAYVGMDFEHGCGGA